MFGLSGFPNEIEMIRECGGKIIYIYRDVPEWLLNKNNSNWISEVKKLGIHESEYAWINEKFDYEIENNNTLEDLYKKLYDILLKIHYNTNINIY